jgi:hypothetical protein
MGGDVDTIGAIAGANGGARRGARDSLARLENCALIESVGIDIFAHALEHKNSSLRRQIGATPWVCGN